jgi:hypothetical protein
MKYEKGTFTTVPLKPLKGYDPLAQIIYVWLCYHANQEGNCFPSYKKICEETGIKSKNTVKEKIKILESNGLLLVNRRENDNERLSNLYQLLIHGISPVDPPISRDDGGYINGCPVTISNELNTLTKPNELNNCKNKFLRENFKDIVKSINPEPNRINDLIGVFQKTVNPTINFGNKTERDSAEKLIKFMGF